MQLFANKLGPCAKPLARQQKHHLATPPAPIRTAPRRAHCAQAQAMPSSKLMNDASTLVQNALDGLIMQHPHLTKLDGFPDVSFLADEAAVGKGAPG